MVNLISYLLILILSFIFTYIFNVVETYVFFTMLLLLPLIDFILYRYIKNKLEIKLYCRIDNIEKNKDTLFEFEVINKGKIPLPYIQYSITLGSNLISSEVLSGVIHISSKSKFNKIFIIQGKHVGLDRVVINKIVIKSIFGLFQKRYIGNIDSLDIAVMPRIVEVDGIDKILEESINTEGEVNENEVYTIKGEPGYEYRDYVQGDPLNKINWKLSAKNNTLLIRKDEGYSQSNKVIILDPYMLTNDESGVIADLLIESTLGIIREIYLLNFNVDVYYEKNKSFMSTMIENDNDIEKIQKSFATYLFSDNANRFSNLIFDYKEKVDFIIISANKDIELSVFVDRIREFSNSILIISNDRSKCIDNDFYVGEDYKLERI